MPRTGVEGNNLSCDAMPEVAGDSRIVHAVSSVRPRYLWAPTGIMSEFLYTSAPAWPQQALSLRGARDQESVQIAAIGSRMTFRSKGTAIILMLSCDDMGGVCNMSTFNNARACASTTKIPTLPRDCDDQVEPSATSQQSHVSCKLENWACPATLTDAALRWVLNVAALLTRRTSAEYYQVQCSKTP
jgi:hypothetical protein